MAQQGIRRKSWYPIAYMFVIMAFFSAILVGFSRFTESRVAANERLAVERAVLGVLPIDVPAGASNQQIHDLYLKNVTPPEKPGEPYKLMKNERVAAYAIPFSGRGFWDVIEGVIGVAPDGRTITGIAFYQQHETPGLGAEITKPRFKDQFRSGGKRVAETGKPLTFVREDEKAGPMEINQITGATQTSVRLERILDERLGRWRENSAAAEATAPAAAETTPPAAQEESK